MVFFFFFFRRVSTRLTSHRGEANGERAERRAGATAGRRAGATAGRRGAAGRDARRGARGAAAIREHAPQRRRGQCRKDGWSSGGGRVRATRKDKGSDDGHDNREYQSVHGRRRHDCGDRGGSWHDRFRTRPRPPSSSPSLDSTAVGQEDCPCADAAEDRRKFYHTSIETTSVGDEGTDDAEATSAATGKEDKFVAFVRWMKAHGARFCANTLSSTQRSAAGTREGEHTS